MELREYRKSQKLTQKEAANLVGIPFRTYLRYETEDSYANSYKYRKIFEDLQAKCLIDETHGILSFSSIKEIVVPILKRHGISYCYLFGSYARNEAKENSDVDLLVDTNLTGIAFFQLIEEIRESLKKRVDLLRLVDLESGNPLARTILVEGIKII